MDQFKSALGSFGGGNDQDKQGSSAGGGGGGGLGGLLGGLGDKVNNAAGGGKEGEKNEDYLDKGEITYISMLVKQPSPAVVANEMAFA